MGGRLVSQFIFYLYQDWDSCSYLLPVGFYAFDQHKSRGCLNQSDICKCNPSIINWGVANCILYLLDPRERQIGERYGACYKDGIEGHFQIPFTDKLEMSIDEVRVMAAQFRQELDNRSLKPYLGL